MSLPLSDIVAVDISVSPTLAPLAGFGELLYFTSETKVLEVISPAERVRLFGSLKEVQDAFPDAVDVVKAATAFYAQTPQPKYFSVGTYHDSAYAGSLTGGKPASLDDLKKVTAGAFKITIDGTVQTLTGISLAGSSDMAAVANTISTSITSKGTCDYVGGRFVVASKTTGQSSTVSFPEATAGGEDLEKLLGLAAVSGAVKADGGNETIEAALNKCLDARQTFVAVVTQHQYRDDATNTVKVAEWCEGSKKIFMNTTNDLRVMEASSVASTVAYTLKNKALRYTITTFGIDDSEYPSASLFGRIATVNYEGTNTTITLKFKKLPAITGLELRQSQKAAMDSVNVGGFMNFGGQLMYAESRMADGGWLDAVHGLMWLEDKVQKNVFNLLYGTATKIPYTDTGINLVKQKVIEACNQAVTNGLCGAGRVPSGEFLPNGYRVIAKGILEVDQADKSNRLYRGISFEMVGAGALHNVVITGTFNE